MQLSSALQLWKTADAVCFDVDSTVTLHEGIDVLAEFCSVGPQVAAYTKSAMEGGVPFREALAVRVHLMKVSRTQLYACLDQRPATLTPGIRQLIALLHKRKVPVYLVSGGFRQMIAPLATALHIPSERIFANTLLFHDDAHGSYKSFDDAELTSTNRGKQRVCQFLIVKHDYKRLVIVGDGVTDLEARPPASLFIGFGGAQTRRKVRDGADWFVTDFQTLIDALELPDGKTGASLSECPSA